MQHLNSETHSHSGSNIDISPTTSERTKPMLEILAPVPITLEDHSESGAHNDEHASTLFNNGDIWCVNCFVGEPYTIEGTNGGKYTLWQIELDTVRGGRIRIRKRYSDFVKLRDQLMSKYGRQTVVMGLPPKTVVLQDRFNKMFLEKRRKGLDYWLHSVVLNPMLCCAPELKAFVTQPVARTSTRTRG
ncbi:unnamed protein product [Ambrosiozyma monospora]|uniref:Unnamed protein product n=1 Tax=Ambrosiozyma monospora TaxID=43982 RepID=A0A9W6WF17_AMBMO|nr:unnamed protein product [Ambrosiozyma monospora]